MKNLKSFCLVAALSSAILPSSAVFRLSAQTNDWQALERTPPGSSITVVVLNHRGRRDCELWKVTDSDLTCELHRGMHHKQLIFLRDDIREVRLEHPERNHTLVGGMIGATLGAGVGAAIGVQSSDPESVAATPELGGLLGAAIGAAVGKFMYQHGPVLYQRK